MAEKKNDQPAAAPVTTAPDPKLLEQMVQDAIRKDQGRKAREARASVRMTKHGLVAEDMNGLYELASAIVRSGWAPKGMSAEACFVAMAKGAEVGLSHIESINSIAVINGRPALWGDAMLGLCLGSGKLEDHQVQWHGEPGQDDYGCTVRVKRKGLPSWTSEKWTVARARQAGLWGKSGPWSDYPERMLELRARGFALRNAFPDVLRGLISAEEAGDIDPGDSPDGAPPPDVDPQADPQEQLVQLYGADKAPNGEAAAERDETAQKAEPTGAEPDKPRDGAKCSRAQAQRLAQLGARIWPEVDKKDMPSHLAGLGWAWNEGPVDREVLTFSGLTEREAAEMIGELEVMLQQMEEAER